MLNYFEELRDKLFKFLQDKFFSTNKYDDIDTIKNEYSKDDELER